MDQEKLNALRHTSAHLLAAVVQMLFPGVKRAIGPSIETGFYYDFDFSLCSKQVFPEGVKISDEDLPKIEAKMGEILQSWNSVEGREVSSDEARELFKNEPYKLEMIEEFSKDGQTLTVYQSGDYVDLCKGGHAENPKEEIGAFKLLSVAGAYWRGSEKNKMLTRIYGTAFPTKEELDKHLEMLEEAKKRDHRKIGRELDLFVVSELIGAGLPLFTPKGTILRNQLKNFSEELQLKAGFQEVWIPHITKIELYKKSGHWDKFGEELFLVESQESDDEFALKPMNCPHHTQIFASQLRTYKELPIRYMETTAVYRDEKKGELGGISRVRSITQDDAHIFCTMDQIEGEFESIMGMIKTMYSKLGMEFKARLSFREPNQPERYLGDESNWEIAQEIIERVAQKLELTYFIAVGEAAFYGPKIDIMVKDSLGREHQLATEQLDFVQPERFGLKYIDQEGSEKTPVMIHKALLGSIERFLSVYIEHTAGVFPVWLSPVQVMIVPITDRHIEYGQKLLGQLREAGVRAEIDERSEKMQAKIRDAQLQKIPYMAVIGDREEEAGQVAVRTRAGENLPPQAFEEFLGKIKEEISERN
jgi:threonyl-tRNA synthetase